MCVCLYDEKECLEDPVSMILFFLFWVSGKALSVICHFYFKIRLLFLLGVKKLINWRWAGSFDKKDLKSVV